MRPCSGRLLAEASDANEPTYLRHIAAGQGVTCVPSVVGLTPLRRLHLGICSVMCEHGGPACSRSQTPCTLCMNTAILVAFLEHAACRADICSSWE